MKEQSENSEKDYRSPSLTVYGSAEAITRDQNSSGADAPGGPGDPGTYYSRP